MSYTSGFFDAIDLGEGMYDRVYAAAQFAHYFSLFVGNGVFPHPSTNMQVVANGTPDMHVIVSGGSGWINGYYVTVSGVTPESLVIPTASGSLPRIDSVIMALDLTNREIQLYVRSGTASASPQPVTLIRTDDLWELELARVSVAAGATAISQSAITDMRSNTTQCGWVTGLIDQIDTTNLFAQYDDAFQEWFADIQAQLSGDVATNLLNRINNVNEDLQLYKQSSTDAINSKLDKSAKATAVTVESGTDDATYITPSALASTRATQAQAEAGTSTTKLMTPLRTKQAIDKLAEESAYKIGDIRSSSRDLETLTAQQTSGRYLRCDGRNIINSAYPTLAENLKHASEQHLLTRLSNFDAQNYNYHYFCAQAENAAGTEVAVVERVQMTNNTGYGYCLRRYAVNSDGTLTEKENLRVTTTTSASYQQYTPCLLFYVGSYLYMHTAYQYDNNGNSYIYLYRFEPDSATFATVWTYQGQYAYVGKCIGVRVSGNTAYVALWKRNSSTYSIHVLAVNGTSVSETQVGSSYSAMSVTTFVLGDYLYVYKTRYLLSNTSSSQDMSSNSAVSEFVNWMTNSNRKMINGDSSSNWIAVYLPRYIGKNAEFVACCPAMQTYFPNFYNPSYYDAMKLYVLRENLTLDIYTFGYDLREIEEYSTTVSLATTVRSQYLNSCLYVYLYNFMFDENDEPIFLPFVGHAEVAYGSVTINTKIVSFLIGFPDKNKKIIANKRIPGSIIDGYFYNNGQASLTYLYSPTEAATQPVCSCKNSNIYFCVINYPTRRESSTTYNGSVLSYVKLNKLQSCLPERDDDDYIRVL